MQNTPSAIAPRRLLAAGLTGLAMAFSASAHAGTDDCDQWVSNEWGIPYYKPCGVVDSYAWWSVTLAHHNNSDNIWYCDAPSEFADLPPWEVSNGWPLYWKDTDCIDVGGWYFGKVYGYVIYP